MNNLSESGNLSYMGVYGFLYANLKHVISEIEKENEPPPDEYTHSRGCKEILIPDIPVLEHFGLNKFSITLLSQKVAGRYTSYCNNIIGCVTEGYSIQDSLKNLCSAITECIIIRDSLNKNIFNHHYEVNMSNISDNVYPINAPEEQNSRLYDQFLKRTKDVISNLDYLGYENVTHGNMHMYYFKEDEEDCPIYTIKKNNDERITEMTWYLIYDFLGL